MKKFFSFFILCFLFFSCSKKKENSSQPSNGKINSISIVIDDQLWKGIIGDSLRNKFAKPVEGLSKEEPQFDINQFPINVFEGFITKNRTIIIVKKGDKNNFSIKKNQYATPQNVIRISGKSLSDLLTIIEKNSQEITKIIQEGEITAHQLLFKDSLLDTQLIQNQLQLSLKVPKTYSYSLKNESFVWLIKEIPSGSTNLLITQFPLNTFKKDKSILNKLTKAHDSIGALYIKSKNSNSSQFIDKTYPIYFSQLTITDLPAYEIKGRWRMKNSFMFGSFIDYAIVDSKNDRVLFIAGFCYIPSGQRRDCRHELEAIIKGVRIN